MATGGSCDYKKKGKRLIRASNRFGLMFMLVDVCWLVIRPFVPFSRTLKIKVTVT